MDVVVLPGVLIQMGDPAFGEGWRRRCRCHERWSVSQGRVTIHLWLVLLLFLIHRESRVIREMRFWLNWLRLGSLHGLLLGRFRGAGLGVHGS